MTTLAPVQQWLGAYRAALFARSLQVPAFLNTQMSWVAAAWIAIAGMGALLRLAVPASPIHNFADALPPVLGYSAIIIAPIAGFMLARAAFGDGQDRAPLDFHLSFVGKWQRLDRAEARRSDLFGPVGFVASLLIGMLLNVVVRTGEFLVAVPAVSTHAPDWSLVLFGVMAMDVVVMSFLYMIAFVMALRSVPLFPRMLLFAWLVDILMQLVIAQQIAGVGSLPPQVAVPLVELLKGNLTKVMISMVVWLPYLIISPRINLTYRSRLRA